jgi:FRG domain-containing protein
MEPKSSETDKAPYERRLLSDVVQSQGDLICSWSDLERFLTGLDGGMDRWCFRGQHRPEWSLVSSLDRMVSRGRRDAEAFLIREFQRSAQHFLRSIPMKDDVLEWLALMQHHGTPTRLLDFTLSPYIGLYFALEHFPIDSGVETDVSAALWAINYVSCKALR